MAGITLAQAEAKLTLAMAAYDKALNATSYSISGGGVSKSVSRADLDKCESAVNYWNMQVNRLSRNGLRVRQITPSDA